MKQIRHYKQLREHGIYYYQSLNIFVLYLSRIGYECDPQYKTKYVFGQLFSKKVWWPFTTDFSWIRRGLYELDDSFESYLNLFMEAEDESEII